VSSSPPSDRAPHAPDRGLTSRRPLPVRRPCSVGASACHGERALAQAGHMPSVPRRGISRLVHAAAPSTPRMSRQSRLISRQHVKDRTRAPSSQAWQRRRTSRWPLGAGKPIRSSAVADVPAGTGDPPRASRPLRREGHVTG